MKIMEWNSFKDKEECILDTEDVKKRLDEHDSQFENIVKKEDMAKSFSSEKTDTEIIFKCNNTEVLRIPINNSATIDPKPTPISYNITNNLTNATNSNEVTSIQENSSYSATITVDEGYTIISVNIKMNDVDITNSVYSSGIINIPNVTGDVIITVLCTKTMPTIDNELLIDMDLTGISDGSVTSFTNTVTNEIATVVDDKLTDIKNSNVSVDSLKNEGALTYAYIFDKNISNVNMQGFRFAKLYDESLYEWNSYGLYISIFCNENAASSVYFANALVTLDFRTLPDINFAVVTMNIDGTLSCYLNGELIYTVPKQDDWESWNMQFYSVNKGISAYTTNSNGNCKPIKHFYAYKGALTSEEVADLSNFFLNN